nr:histone deacetylase 5 [Tanacetum cinerariifolium]
MSGEGFYTKDKSGFLCFAIGDPLGGYRITPNGYAVLLKKEPLMEFSSGKIIMALERGYNLESLENSILACHLFLNQDSNESPNEGHLLDERQMDMDRRKKYLMKLSEKLAIINKIIEEKEAENKTIWECINETKPRSALWDVFLRKDTPKLEAVIVATVFQLVRADNHKHETVEGFKEVGIRITGGHKSVDPKRGKKVRFALLSREMSKHP